MNQDDPQNQKRLDLSNSNSEDDAPGPAAGAPGESPAAPPEDEEEGSGLDARVFLVALVIIALIIAAYLNSRRRKEPELPAEPAASGPSQKLPEALARKYAEGYQHAVALQSLLTTGERVFLMALPGRLLRSNQNRAWPQPARLFDITRRAKGVNPGSFVRARGPAGNLLFCYPPVALGAMSDLKPVLKKANEVAALPSNARVIGVVHKGQSRAYLLPMMHRHPIINDVIGETPILVVWSAVVKAPCAFVRPAKDKKPRRFAFAGLVHNSALVLYDLRTGTLWSSLDGSALAGKLVNQKMAPLNAVLASWEYWKNQHPKTAVLGRPKVRGLSYAQMPLPPPEDYFKKADPRLYYPVEGFDPRRSPINPKEPVLGIVHNGKARAYSYGELRGAEGGTITDTLGGAKIVVSYHPTGAFAEARLASPVGKKGPLLPSRSMLWIAWKGLHRDSTAYGAAIPPAPKPGPADKSKAVGPPSKPAAPPSAPAAPPKNK